MILSSITMFVWILLWPVLWSIGHAGPLTYTISLMFSIKKKLGSSWSCDSWIYNYLCNGLVYSIQHYVIKIVNDLWQVSGFYQVTSVASTNKTDCHDITEILLKVLVNTTAPDPLVIFFCFNLFLLLIFILFKLDICESSLFIKD